MRPAFGFDCRNGKGGNAMKEVFAYVRDHWLPLTLIVVAAYAVVWVYRNRDKLQLIKKNND